MTSIKLWSPLVLAVLFSAEFGVGTAVQGQQVAPPDQQTIYDAYVYLLSRALVIRQEQHDRKADGFAYNQISYNPLGSSDFVNPNFDVAYLEAWVAVDQQTPVMLEVPKIEGRYYTAQILDEWGEVITNINERTFPSRPYGTFALVAPGSTATVPEGAVRVELHSNKAKVLGRVELKGDPEGAVALQKQFVLSPSGSPALSDPPAIPDFDNKSLIGAKLFDYADAIIGSASDVSPPAAALQQKARALAAYVASSDAARAEVDKLISDKLVPAFIEDVFTKSAPYRDHWVGGGAEVGNYASNFRARAWVNYGGIWANAPSEVIYFAATKDADEETLNGSNSYVIHFPADKLPDTAVNSYWSIILVGVPDYRVVPNDLNRFNFNSYSGLKPEADGSLKIAIGPNPVAGIAESNWLPSPEGKPFSLTLRTYVPKEQVLAGAWSPPAVTKVE